MTASMVVIDSYQAKVLLVFHKASQLWVFPGGHIDPNETPGEAAVREVLEETGVRAIIRNERVMSLPGMTLHPSPWITAEIAAPAKPERPGKPAEPAHSHIDLLFVGTADSTQPLDAKVDEVDSARWWPIIGFYDYFPADVRAEVPLLTRTAYGEF